MSLDFPEGGSVPRDVVLTGGGVTLRPLDTEHAAAIDEAVAESAAELRETVPWWRPGLTVHDHEAWARFSRDAWQDGTL